MYRCTFCGSELPNHASFCGRCGSTTGGVIEAPTRASGLLLPDIQDSETVTSMSMPANSAPAWVYDQRISPDQPPTAPSDQNEDEEERRRRAAMIGLGVPLLGSLAVEEQQYAGNVPTVQGTPQMTGVPTVHGVQQPGGTPSAYAPPLLPGSSIGQGIYASPTVMAPQLPSSPPTYPPPVTTTTLHHPNPPHSQPQGCSTLFITIAISIPILLIISFIGLGYTVLAPSLSLSGSTSVLQGGTFTLHGDHFFPGSSVSLTLDDTIPLYFTIRNLPIQLVSTGSDSMLVSGIDQQVVKQFPLTSNTVSVGGDGTFDVTITASPNWLIGNHTIEASESLTHRSAQLEFTVYAAGTTPTPTSTDTATPTMTATPTVTVSPSPTITLTPTSTTTSLGLSCVNPSSLSLGPVTQGNNQPVSAQITLCTTGSGTVNWTATWDQNAAPWIQLDLTSGQITAPGKAQVKVSALASNLAPGSYSVTLTFTGQPDNVTESLPVIFTVQAGCVHGNPGSLTFNGVANVSDPATQTVTVTNCGPSGAFSASAQTSNGASWLFASPTTGTLNAGTSTSVTISASNLKAQLAAGTYTGTVNFKIGSATFTVNVTLTVVPAPILSGTPTSIFANQQCIFRFAGYYTCYVSLTNTSSSLSLSWSATSTGLTGVTFNPNSSTLSPGQTIRVQINVPQSNCPAKGPTLNFTGPANTVIVQWYC